MSNERKLLHHEKPVWRKVFDAKVAQSLSVEAAAKHAWQAVHIWNAVGAFNEPDPVIEGWSVLAKYFLDLGSPGDLDDLRNAILGFDSEDWTIEEFKLALQKIDALDNSSDQPSSPIFYEGGWKELLNFFDNHGLPHREYSEMLFDWMRDFTVGKLDVDAFATKLTTFYEAD